MAVLILLRPVAGDQAYVNGPPQGFTIAALSVEDCGGQIMLLLAVRFKVG